MTLSLFVACGGESQQVDPRPGGSTEPGDQQPDGGNTAADDEDTSVGGEQGATGGAWTGGADSGGGMASGGATDMGGLDGSGGESQVDNTGGGFDGAGGDRNEGTGGAPTEVTCTGAVYDDDVWLRSQSDVDAFAGVEIVTGNLQIDDDPDTPITTLEPLSCLVKAGAEDIGGDYNRGFYIKRNRELRSLAGLSRLRRVVADLVVMENDVLEDLGDFSSLEEIEGHLTLIGNPLLTDLSGVSSLSSLSGHLRIDQNDSLLELDDLESLVNVPILQIYDNERLVNVDRLLQLSPPSDCFITRNPALPQCQIDLLLEEWGTTCGGTDNDETAVCSP